MGQNPNPSPSLSRTQNSPPERSCPAELEGFLANFRAAIIVLSGGARGMEYVLDQYRVTIGRGPGVDLALDDESLRQQHAVLEFVEGGFRLRLLDNEEGMELRGRPPILRELKPDDHFCLGNLSFSYLVEPRQSSF